MAVLGDSHIVLPFGLKFHPTHEAYLRLRRVFD